MRLLVVDLAIRLPYNAWVVLAMLRVVDVFHRSYAWAGLISAVIGVTTSLGAGRRGRLLDRAGLRRALLTPIAVLVGVAVSVPFAGYWEFLTLMAIGGVFAIPGFAAIRGALTAAVPRELQPAALALPAVMAEVGYMVGPLGGIAVADHFGNTAAITVFLAAYPLGGAALWLLDPALVTQPARPEPTSRAPQDRSGGLRLPHVIAMAFGGALVMAGGDLCTVNAMQNWHRPELIGMTIAIWATASAISGLLYGSLARRPSAAVLLSLNGATMALAALALSPWIYIAALFVNGLFIAPTTSALSDLLVRLVPPNRLGEALAKQSAAMLVGAAVAEPAAGVIIDASGWRLSVLLAGVAGVAIAAAAAVGDMRATRHRLGPSHPAARPRAPRWPGSQ